MATELPDLPKLHEALQLATLKCSERCVYHAAKWAAELLTSMAPLPATPAGELPPAYLHPLSTDKKEAALEAQEFSQYLLAKSYFDVKEYDRCSHVLEKCTSRKAVFLHLYSKYIAGEKRKDEASEMVLGPLDGAGTQNKEISYIMSVLQTKVVLKDGERVSEDDSFLVWLYGICLLKQKNESAARDALIASVVAYPYNWSAWQDLASTVGSLQDLNNILPSLPNNIMSNLFVLSTNQELYQTTEPIHSQLTDLLVIFPTSSWLKTQRALLYYHARDFEEADQIFDALLAVDPYRLDYLDHYSNILYVMERRPKLGFIAQLALTTDRFRPETNCVVGNFYSLKSEHEKAVQCFRRALTLDKTCLSAWTLMGHEYVEMKNTHAAIEAYRRAVDINRKDYRAWYGLGLSYEVLEMHYYALFYFQRAAALRPYDSQMWQAMGQCYDRMNRPSEAIRSFKRALVTLNKSPSSSKDEPETRSFDPQILHQIAVMYEKLRQSKEAAKWMEACMAEEENVGVTTVTGQARMWLARWAFVNQNWARAQELANLLCQDGQEVEEAKALVRDLRSRGLEVA
ncbi:anaphase promoting complex subunit 8 [Pyronema omphalodes]|nr:anaphase promoting complex subunit 8 [Pyronema omphalodes]